jgi:UDP-3-O-[3-hydroxymyristoyl] glucosamine N-acyltransferase
VKTGIHETAVVEDSAKTGKGIYLGAHAYIGEHASVGDRVKIYPQVYIGDNVEIGDDTIIYPGVQIYENCIIGKDCVLHSGTVIGSDGFGFAPRSDQDYKKVPQVGNVILEDWVEIGANTTIDRATMGSTIIRRGVKLDNLVQVAHNVEIGENTVIAAQSGISGSSTVGKNCLFGGQVGLAGHLIIADGVKIGAQSGIPSSIKEPGIIIQGTPPQEIRDFQRSAIIFRRLPDLKARVDALEKELETLKKS